MRNSMIALGLVLVASPAAADKVAVKKLEKGGTYDCAKDSAVSINNGMGTYTFKGRCTKIVVDGGVNKLTIESVEMLDVSGAENTIAITTVGSIDVSGADNTITWKKALKGDKPSIKAEAGMNKISQAK